MARLKIPHRETDKLKRKLEDLIVAFGGAFADKHGSGGKIKSTYTLAGKSFTRFWHASPSDVRVVKLERTQIRRALANIGVRDLSRASFYSKTGAPSRQTPEQTLAWREFEDAMLEHLISELPE